MKRIFSFFLIFALLFSLSLPIGAAAEASRVADMVSAMSLREKIAQMLMIDFRDWDEDPTDEQSATGFTVMNSQVAAILKDYDFGAVILFSPNLKTTEQAFQLVMDMQKAAVADDGIPMLICADQEGGSVYRLSSGTALPGNMALGAAQAPSYAQSAGRIIGSELSVLGINTSLSPVVDVNSNANNPVIGLRAYSDDPVTVGKLASAAIMGMAEYNVIGCAKHFPGHGDTGTDSHYGLPSVSRSRDELLACELAPYQDLISQGIEMIMTAHILYPTLEPDTLLSQKTGKQEMLPATMSDDIITGLLKQELGFEGIVVTDAMNMKGISDFWNPAEAVIHAISAGVDMICMPVSMTSLNDLPKMDAILDAVEEAVTLGVLPLSRIDDAVTRILTVKANRGILDWSASDFRLETALATVGCADNREAERIMSAAAVTVTQNKNNTLPLILTPKSRVLMLVPYNNETGQMIMGWNRAREAGLIPDGAEVRVLRFSKDTAPETFQEDIDWADILIFNSEVGSVGSMNGAKWVSSYPLQVIDYAEAQGKTTIVQSADKPYDVQSYPNADAVLAVYGCKGSSVDPTEALLGGITSDTAAFGPNLIAGLEVIFGVYGACGKLPVDIPLLKDGVYTDTLVYERGYGLTYDSLLSNSEPDSEPAESEPESESEVETESSPETEIPGESAPSSPDAPSDEEVPPTADWMILHPAVILCIMLLSLGALLFLLLRAKHNR